MIVLLGSSLSYKRSNKAYGALNSLARPDMGFYNPTRLPPPMNIHEAIPLYDVS